MSGDSPADIIASMQSIFTDDYCWYAGAAFLAYECMITLGEEVDLFWRRPKTGASILFFLNRYLALLGILCGMLEYLPKTEESCTMAIRAQAAVNYLQYIPWAAFSGLRAYALSNQNWPLSLLVFGLSIVPFGINIGQFAWGLTGFMDSMYGCSADLPITAGFARKITIASRSCLIASDTLLVVITLIATLKWQLLYSGSGMRKSGSITTILLRDGTIYFFVLLALNSLHLTFTMLSINGAFEPLSYFSDFTEPATAVLVSRFLLDLQLSNQRALNTNETEESGHLETLIFNRNEAITSRVIGSLGSSLTYGVGHLDGEEVVSERNDLGHEASG